MKKRNNWHRHDYTEPDDGTKPVQAGTPVFIKELQNRAFARYVLKLNVNKVTKVKKTTDFLYFLVHHKN